MLAINRRFTVITYPEIREELVQEFEMLDIVIEDTHYRMNPQCNKILRVIHNCKVSEDRFEDIVKWLEIRFKDSWASLIY